MSVLICELTHLSKRYGSRHAVRDVALAIAPHEIVGLVGPNGAGKTTLLRLIAGLVRPSAGDISHGARVVYFGGEPTLPPAVSARRWAAAVRGDPATAVTTARFSVLSRGTRQRIGLETILFGAGLALVLLDEPWEGLDPDASRWLSEELLRVRAAGAGILVSSHRIHDLAGVCDRCEFLIEGTLSKASVTCAELAPHERANRLLGAFDTARGRQ